MTYSKAAKEMFKRFEVGAEDLLVPEDEEGDFSLEDIEVSKEIHASYLDILRVAKRLHKKGIYSISFILQYLMTAISHGPDDTDDILAIVTKYYLDKVNYKDDGCINLFDDSGNRMKIEDLDKL
jgi:hypothetical protein